MKSAMRTVDIGVALLDLPNDWEVISEDETTTLARPRKCYTVALRITSATVRKDGIKVEGAGTYTIRRLAHQANAPIHEAGGTIWYKCSKSATEGAPGSMVHYWYCGRRAHALVISCFVDGSVVNLPLALEATAATEAAVRSLRDVK